MLVLFAVMLTALIGFVGLAVDVGRIELRKVQFQAAADAGALSAADEWGRRNTSWAAAAATDAQAVATANGLGTVTVTSQLSAATGPYTADFAAVQTTVSQAVPTIFIGVLSSGAKTVTVTATAVADPPPCVYLLGFQTDGVTSAYLASASIDIRCPMYSRGIPVVDGFSRINNHQVKSSAVLSGQAPGGGSETYTPFWNYPVLSDPLAYVTQPSYTGCDNAARVNVITPGQTLLPGRYCGILGFPGITVAGVPVTMAPGLYVVTGGVNFQNTTLTGTGVTIYLTKGGGVGYGQFFAASSTINLNAPTVASGGSIVGITLFADRNWVGGIQDLVFSSTQWNGDGIIYSKATGLYEYNSNFSAPNYMNWVVMNETSFLGGTAHFFNNYASLSGGNPLHNATTLVQ